MQTESGLPVLTENLGTVVTYKDPAADDVSLTGVLSDVATPVEFDSQGNRTAGRQRTITVGKDSTAAYGGIASVNLKDGRFEIADVSWKVLEVESETASTFRLRLGRPTAITRGRPELHKGE